MDKKTNNKKSKTNSGQQHRVESNKAKELKQKIETEQNTEDKSRENKEKLVEKGTRENEGYIIPKIRKEEAADDLKEKASVIEADNFEKSEVNLGKKRKKSIIGIALGVIGALSIAALSIVYYRKAMYYDTHFLPNTTVNGIVCDEMDAETLIALLDAPIATYTLEVVGRDYATGKSGAVLGTIVPEDIQLIYQGTKEAVEKLLEQQNGFYWIFSYRGDAYTYDVSRVIAFDEKMLEDTIRAWDACKSQNMLKAESAYISEYSDSLRKYEIIEETIGSELDVSKVIELVADVVYQQVGSLNVEKEDCYKDATVKCGDEDLQVAVDTANKWLSASITYEWNGTKVILDSEILKDWISIEDNRPLLDEEAVAGFVEEQASVYDTYGKNGRFRTSLGVDLSLLRRSYGWKTDVEAETEELIAMIYEGCITQREPIYVEGITARQKGENDIGNSYVEADLTNQHLYLYMDGKLVLETDFVSGDMSKNRMTPQGIFGLTYKSRNAVLRGADYEDFVYYWMPFYRGYGMHDATWRDEFGGDIYLEDGSHGCLNLPLEIAGEIYQYMSKGFPVICYYYDVNPLAVQAETQETEPAEATAGEAEGM